MLDHGNIFDEKTNTMLQNDRSELRDFDLTTSEDVNNPHNRLN